MQQNIYERTFKTGASERLKRFQEKERLRKERLALGEEAEQRSGASSAPLPGIRGTADSSLDSTPLSTPERELSFLFFGDDGDAAGGGEEMGDHDQGEAQPVRQDPVRGFQTPGTPRVFAGNSDDPPEEFLRLFELWAKARGLTAEQMATNLPLFLSHSALESFWSIPEAERGNYENLKRELLVKLRPPGLNRLNAGKLYTCKQESGETVQSFANRLASMFRLAYPTSTDDMREGLLLDLFIRNLNPRVQLGFLNCSPRTFEEAVTSARQIEANLRLLPNFGVSESVEGGTKKSKLIKKVSFCDDDDDEDRAGVEASMIGRFRNEMLEAVDKLSRTTEQQGYHQRLTAETLDRLVRQVNSTDLPVSPGVGRRDKASDRFPIFPSHGGPPGRREGGGDGRGRPQVPNPQPQQRAYTEEGLPICFLCNRVGHIRRQCNMRRRAAMPPGMRSPRGTSDPRWPHPNHNFGAPRSGSRDRYNNNVNGQSNNYYNRGQPFQSERSGGGGARPGPSYGSSAVTRRIQARPWDSGDEKEVEEEAWDWEQDQARSQGPYDQDPYDCISAEGAENWRVARMVRADACLDPVPPIPSLSPAERAQQQEASYVLDWEQALEDLGIPWEEEGIMLETYGGISDSGGVDEGVGGLQDDHAVRVGKGEDGREEGEGTVDLLRSGALHRPLSALGETCPSWVRPPFASPVFGRRGPGQGSPGQERPSEVSPYPSDKTSISSNRVIILQEAGDGVKPSKGRKRKRKARKSPEPSHGSGHGDGHQAIAPPPQPPRQPLLPTPVFQLLPIKPVFWLLILLSSIRSCSGVPILSQPEIDKLGLKGQICVFGRSGHPLALPDPASINCSSFANHTAISQQEVEVFGPRTSPITSGAALRSHWTTITCAWVSFLGSTHLVNQSRLEIDVTKLECQLAWEHRRWRSHSLSPQGPTEFTHEEVPKVPYSYCCTTTCHVAHGFRVELGHVSALTTKTAYSNLAVLTCPPRKGSCSTSVGLLVWDEGPFEDLCPLQSLGKAPARLSQDRVVVWSKAIACSFSHATPDPCSLGAFQSDQGLWIKFSNFSASPLSEARPGSARYADSDDHRRLETSILRETIIGKQGKGVSANLRSTFFQYLLALDFNRIYAELCEAQKHRVELTLGLAQVSPTAAIRALLGRTDVGASLIGTRLFAVSPCLGLNLTRVYLSKKVGNLCFELTPVSLSDGRTKFLMSGGNDIVSFSPLVPCSQVKLDWLQLANGSYLSMEGVSDSDELHLSHFRSSSTSFHFDQPPVSEEGMAAIELSLSSMSSILRRQARLQGQINALTTHASHSTWDPRGLQKAVREGADWSGAALKAAAQGSLELASKGLSTTTSLLSSPFQWLKHALLAVVILGLLIGVSLVVVCLARAPLARRNISAFSRHVLTKCSGRKTRVRWRRRSVGSEGSVTLESGPALQDELEEEGLARRWRRWIGRIWARTASTTASMPTLTPASSPPTPAPPTPPLGTPASPFVSPTGRPYFHVGCDEACGSDSEMYVRGIVNGDGERRGSSEALPRMVDGMGGG